MSFHTKKIDSSLSRIVANGVETSFVIEKGDDPKWGDHREWHIFQVNDGGTWPVGPVMTVYRRKSDALAAFASIWREATP